jgi:hypothetical protein
MQFISNNKKYRVPFVYAFRIIYLNTEIEGILHLMLATNTKTRFFFENYWDFIVIKDEGRFEAILVQIESKSSLT